MIMKISKSSKLPTEQEARKELSGRLGCKIDEIEVAIDTAEENGVKVVSFYVQQIGEFDGPTIQIKLPPTRFLVGGLEH
jgi:hypothetical protein